jgi:hypothetical protein
LIWYWIKRNNGWSSIELNEMYCSSKTLFTEISMETISWYEKKHNSSCLEKMIIYYHRM